MKEKEQHGFTLIEIIVALGLFAVVGVVAVGTIMRVVDANKKAQTLRLTVDNINFTLESMSRELRVGTSYHCRDDAADTGGLTDASTLSPQACDVADRPQLVAFKSSRVDPIDTSCQLINVYRFRPDNVSSPTRYFVEKAEQSECNGALIFDPLISDEIVVLDYRLSVSEQAYPLLFLRIIGYSGKREIQRTSFDVQATISQRLLD